MIKPVLLISDLHLQQSRPDITATLFRFLQERRDSCGALYILGDLFEVWIGDDAHSPLADSVAAALKVFTGSGAGLYLLHGNRDFLMGESFAASCGGTLIAEPHELVVGDTSYLLLHGDTLCTGDLAYQAYRRQVRDPVWQREFLSQPIARRRAFALAAREESTRAAAGKTAEIMDVSPTAVLELIENSRHTRIIHGHTHRPARHLIDLERPVAGCRSAVRTVLGDWDSEAWHVEITGSGMTLHHFPLIHPDRQKTGPL